MIIQVRQASLQEKPLHVCADIMLDMPAEFELEKPASFIGECLCIREGLFLVTGTLEFECKTFCARCLKPVSIQLSVPFEERFAREDTVQGDEEIYAYTGGEINTDRALSEAAFMALPMRVLCREDCKGLCPVCGADQNENECGCPMDSDNAFSVLKQLDLP